jgi:hypothetical protein
MELVISVALSALVMTVLAAAVSVTLRTTPSTEGRLDDARSTRGLATWLSHDTTSAPRFLPERPQGGINLDTSTTAPNNCGGDGTNLLHLTWLETGTITQTFVANYRLVQTGPDSAMIARYTCVKPGVDPLTAFASTSRTNLTSRLKLSQPPIVIPTWSPTGCDPSFDPLCVVTSISFTLTGVAGDQVVVTTGSRNPTDFFS